MIITKNGGSSHWSLPPPKRRRTLFLHGRQFQLLCKDGNHPPPTGGKIPTRSPSWSKASFSTPMPFTKMILASDSGILSCRSRSPDIRTVKLQAAVRRGQRHKRGKTFDGEFHHGLRSSTTCVKVPSSRSKNKASRRTGFPVRIWSTSAPCKDAARNTVGARLPRISSGVGRSPSPARRDAGPVSPGKMALHQPVARLCRH